MNQSPDNYFINGCGRCELGGTPACKVHRWTHELALLRSLVLDCGLQEEAKWGMPCYTVGGKNVLIISAFKEYCSINFFKGVLLKDDKQRLQKAGENSQSARLLKFTGVEAIVELEEEIKQFINEAVKNEQLGRTVTFKKELDPLPEELIEAFEQDPALKEAFYALTPGRQRGYLLHFNAPKQSKTRVARIEKCIGLIFKGEGLNDGYKKKG